MHLGIGVPIGIRIVPGRTYSFRRLTESFAPPGLVLQHALQPTADAVSYPLPVLRTSCLIVPDPAVRLTYTPRGAHHPAAVSGPEGRKTVAHGTRGYLFQRLRPTGWTRSGRPARRIQ